MKREIKGDGGQTINLACLAQSGLLPELVENYVLDCIRRADEEGRKKRIMPNVSGFCRYCRVGREELEELKNSFPTEYGALLSVFEDEALNSDISASTLAYYMKNFLGRDTEEKSEQVIRFEHDVLRDGE